MNSIINLPTKPLHCELCGRPEQLTKHHLIPRMRHRNKRIQKQFNRTELHSRILWVCRPCHSHIHNVLTEHELANVYNTRDILLNHPAIQRFIVWIQNKPVGFKPASCTTRR